LRESARDSGDKDGDNDNGDLAPPFPEKKKKKQEKKKEKEREGTARFQINEHFGIACGYQLRQFL